MESSGFKIIFLTKASCIWRVHPKALFDLLVSHYYQVIRGSLERKGKKNPEIQFICKTYRVALKHVHNEERGEKKICPISGSLRKTKLVQITDFGKSAVGLRSEDLRTKALWAWVRKRGVKGCFRRKHVCLHINFMSVVSLGMTIIAYEK